MTEHEAYEAGPDAAATRVRQAERRGLWRILAISLAAAMAALTLAWWFFG